MRPNDILPEEDLLIQLSEESAELSQAAAKLARHIMGRNPTGKSTEELRKSLEEEMADVWVTAEELPYRPRWHVIQFKQNRWIQNLMQKIKKDKGIPEEADE